MTARPLPVHDIRDGLARAIGIPGFGLLIPHFVGLFGPLTWEDGLFWLGTVGFVGLALVLWQGNRWLLFRQRERLDWFERPVFKLVALLFACSFFTAPVTLLWIAAWFKIAQLPVDVGALREVTLTNVICVLIVTHGYETVFLIKGRERDALTLSEMERAVLTAQLEALRKQVEPHFLFNSLNTLAALIEVNAPQAARFNAALAEVYRFLLDDRPLVELSEELDFARSYASLLSIRFERSIDVHIEAGACAGELVPPTAVQSAIENAVKHSRFDEQTPLRIDVRAQADHEGAWIQVTNPLRPKRAALPSSGTGLSNLDERCRLLLGRRLVRGAAAGVFEVRIPVGSLAT